MSSGQTAANERRSGGKSRIKEFIGTLGAPLTNWQSFVEIQVGHFPRPELLSLSRSDPTHGDLATCLVAGGTPCTDLRYFNSPINSSGAFDISK